MKYTLLAIAFLFAVPGYAFAANVSASTSVTACTMEYAPVCGYKILANNQCVGDECKAYETYSNQCMMKADGATFAHTGECTASELKQNPEKPAEPPKAYTPPKGCIAWYDGCNSCSNGACTKKACFAYEPGYCTKWDETPIPVEPDGGIGNTPPSVPVADGYANADVDAGVSSDNLFVRLWLSFLAWF